MIDVSLYDLNTLKLEMQMIPIYSPRVFTDSAKKALESGWISSQGEYIDKTKELLSKTLNVPYVILMNNGTSATHMLIKALKFKYPDLKKIYVPNNVFIAVWNVILYEYPEGVMEVMEMDPTTLNMRTDEDYIQSLDSNSAVMIVHNIGNIVNVPRLKRLRPDIIFIEDNCEGLFGSYEGIYSGTSTSSLCSAVSFFANKTITCGEGGAFFTHDKDLYAFIYASIHHGLSEKRYVYDMLGYNYRMTNIQAALLYDQLVNLESIRKDKQNVFEYYVSKLKHNVILPSVETNTVQSNWMFVCGIPGKRSFETFEAYMKSKGVDVRPFFYDIQVHTHLTNVKREVFQLDTVSYVMLPSYPDLTFSQIDIITDAVLSFLSSNT
jgi:perosamine synthetase